ncbi:MAG TPA: class I SAM-dependent RNA methyltransferase [Bryobacteraceae bacterium]|nr:class I SAM-dependent RNA methyltransferase [Bryobacteraceae bacterium]
MVPFRLPTEETLTIEKLVYGGDGLARVGGKVVLIPYALPGEVVRATVEKVKNDLFRGRVIEVLSPSAARVEPPCPYFLHCGGCHYQNANYTFQVEQKTAILREVLRRVGKIEYDGEIGTILEEPWQYRNRVQLHVEDGKVGYYEHGSHRLCAIDHCPIASPKLNEVIGTMQALGVTTGVELFTNETDVQVNVLDRVPKPALAALASLGVTGPIEYNGFRVSRNSFFQVNRFLVDALVEAATADANGDWAVDLYAGVGLFAKSLAARFERVTAVESNGSAFADLEHNLGQIALHQATEDYLAALEERPDFILADPPRSGLGKHAVRELARIRAPRLTIISCDPATLARDLQGLLAEGYRIGKITLADLFPQTFHLETVVALFA